MKLCAGSRFPLAYIEVLVNKEVSQTPIGKFALMLLNEKAWSNEFTVCAHLDMNGKGGTLTIEHPTLTNPITFNLNNEDECPTMSEVINRILEVSNTEKGRLDQQIRVLEEKRSRIEHTANRIDSDIAIAAAREKYPELGKVRLYSKWTDFYIYLVDGDGEDGVFRAPVFVRMNDPHEVHGVTEILFLERVTYYMWTKLDDTSRLRELFVARAIDALRASNYLDAAEQVIKGNFTLQPSNPTSEAFETLSINGTPMIFFDSEVGMYVTPRYASSDV